MLTDNELDGLRRSVVHLVARYGGNLEGTVMTVAPTTLAALVDEVTKAREQASGDER